jgi:hypothetical protein
MFVSIKLIEHSLQQNDRQTLTAGHACERVPGCGANGALGALHDHIGVRNEHEPGLWQGGLNGADGFARAMQGFLEHAKFAFSDPLPRLTRGKPMCMPIGTGKDKVIQCATAEAASEFSRGVVGQAEVLAQSVTWFGGAPSVQRRDAEAFQGVEEILRVGLARQEVGEHAFSLVVPHSYESMGKGDTTHRVSWLRPACSFGYPGRSADLAPRDALGASAPQASQIADAAGYGPVEGAATNEIGWPAHAAFLA